jgi:hypothetical protein
MCPLDLMGGTGTVIMWADFQKENRISLYKNLRNDGKNR